MASDDPDAPTVLVYGHHDVQPAAREDGWHTDPFEPTVVDGRMYARGAADDKGQVFFHTLGVRAHLAATGRTAPPSTSSSWSRARRSPAPRTSASWSRPAPGGSPPTP